MQPNQNASSPSGSKSTASKSNHTDATKKAQLTVNVGGNIIGNNYAKFMTRAGEFIRARIPIKFTDWRNVPPNFKDDLWNVLMGEFEMNVDPNLVHSDIEREFPSKFRYFKNSLRRNVLRKSGSKDEAIAACPIGYNPAIWKEFVDREFTREMIAICARNSENRKMNMICHNLGRCNYVNKGYIVEGSNEKVVQEDRANRWLRGHEQKDGTVHPSAVEKYNEIKAAQEKRKNRGEGSNSQLEDLDSDVMTEVFGPDVKGVRGHASHVSKKRAKEALVAASVLDKKVDPLNTYVTEMRSDMGKMSSTLKIVVQQLQHVTLPHPVEGDGGRNLKDRSSLVSKSRKASMSLSDHCDGTLGSGDRNASMVFGRPKVDLLDNKGVVVASRYIITGKDGEMCHNRKVNVGEKKVFLEVVHDAKVAVWDAPQGDDCYRLGDIIEGG